MYKANEDAAVFTSLPISEFVKAKPGGKERQVDNKEMVACGSETDSGDENDENCMPEPLTALFDPTAINLTNEVLSVHAKKIYTNIIYQQTFRIPMIAFVKLPKSKLHPPLG